MVAAKAEAKKAVAATEAMAMALGIPASDGTQNLILLKREIMGGSGCSNDILNAIRKNVTDSLEQKAAQEATQTICSVFAAEAGSHHQ